MAVSKNAKTAQAKEAAKDAAMATAADSTTEQQVTPLVQESASTKDAAPVEVTQEVIEDYFRNSPISMEVYLGCIREAFAACLTSSGVSIMENGEARPVCAADIFALTVKDVVTVITTNGQKYILKECATNEMQ